MIRKLLVALFLFCALGTASAGCRHYAVEMRIVPVNGQNPHWRITFVDQCGCCTTVCGAVNQPLTELLDAPPGWEWQLGWRRCEWRPDLGEWIVVDNGTVTRRKSL